MPPRVTTIKAASSRASSTEQEFATNRFNKARERHLVTTESFMRAFVGATANIIIISSSTISEYRARHALLPPELEVAERRT